MPDAQRFGQSIRLKSKAGANTKSKYRTSSSPESIKLDALSFKSRALKLKPTMSLGDTAKK